MNFPLSLHDLANAVELARSLEGPMPPYWRIAFPPEPGYCLTEEELGSAEWDGTLDYAMWLHEAAGSMEEALSSYDGQPSQAEIAAAATGVINATAEAGLYYNPGLGRPSAPAQNFQHWVSGTIKAAERAAKEGLSVLEVIERRSKSLHADMLGLYELYFCGTTGSGTPSVGWLSEDEKEAFLAKLLQIVSKATQAKLLHLWMDNGGSPTDDALADLWLRIWGTILGHTKVHDVPSQKDGIYALFKKEAYQPSDTATDRSRYARTWLKRLGVTNNADTLFANLDRMVKAFVDEIACIDQLIDTTDAPPHSTPGNRAEVEHLSREAMDLFREHLVDSGILPAIWDPTEVELVVRPPNDKNTTTASCRLEDGSIEVTSYEGREQDWAEKIANRLPGTIAHELTHSGQRRQDQIDNSSINVIGAESGAHLVHKIFAKRTGNLYDIKVMLEQDMAMLLVFMLALKYHLGIEPDLDAIMAEYLERRPLPAGIAKRVRLNISGGITIYGMYALGILWMDELVYSQYDGEIEAAAVDLSRTTSLVIQPNVLHSDFDPKGKPLRFDHVPLAIRVSRELYPPEA